MQVNRYQELKELVHKKVATLTQQREKLLWEQKTDTEKMSFDRRRQKETEVYIYINHDLGAKNNVLKIMSSFLLGLC